METVNSEQKLFGPSAEAWNFNACLHFTHDQWELYAQGYEEAASCLYNEIVDRRGILDVLVYPLVYVCRHGLELRLKALIRDATCLLDAPVKTMPSGHRIDQLWNDVRLKLVRVFPGGESELAAIDLVIKQFCEEDPASTAFRYPTETTGKPSLEGIRHLNVIIFFDLYREAAQLLTGASDGVREYLDSKTEMESSYGCM
jgi:hypothetical protein